MSASACWRQPRIVVAKSTLRKIGNGHPRIRGTNPAPTPYVSPEGPLLTHYVIRAPQSKKIHRRGLRLVLLSLLGFVAMSYNFLLAETVPAPSQNQIRLLTPGEMRSDYKRLRKMLEEVHPGLYRYSTKAQMDHVFNAGRAKLNRPLTSVQFWAVASETIAQIHCGHTKMDLDDHSKVVMADVRKFPLRVVLQGRRIIVLLNDTADDGSIRPGMEITRINGHSAAEIINIIEPTVPGDGDIETGRLHEIGNLFPQYYWLLFEQTNEFAVEVKDESGRRESVHLSGVTDAERRTNQNPVNAAIMKSIVRLRGWSPDNLSIRFLPGTDAAEIHIGHFVGDNFSDWVEKTFNTLQQKHTKILILDLRGNGGGEDKDVWTFLSFLVDKPVRYLDHVDVKTIAPSFQDQLGWSSDFVRILKERTVPNPQGGYLLTSQMLPALADQSPGDYPFRGQVFVLIDGGTFSGASDLSALLHHLKRATFIGEETGGGYYGNSSGKLPTVTMSASGLKLQLTLYGYWNAVLGDPGERRGTRPDVVVETNITSVVLGQDQQLDEALRLSGYGPFR